MIDEIEILEKLKEDLAYLVRVKLVILSKNEVASAEYKKVDIDGRKIIVSVVGS